MYKGSPLPKNCPPIEAKETDESTILYRILLNDEIKEEEFRSYRQLYPKNSRYQNLCIAYAVSMFNDLDFALLAYRKASKKNRVLGSYIAELIIRPDYGKFELNPQGGHCSFWFYEACNFNEIECKRIISINEYS